MELLCYVRINWFCTSFWFIIFDIEIPVIKRISEILKGEITDIEVTTDETNELEREIGSFAESEIDKNPIVEEERWLHITFL